MFKYIFNRDWNFEDYKVDISEHPEYSEKNLRFSAKFINALDRRFGSTPEEAIERLRIFFTYQKQNKKLPRPGSSQLFQPTSNEKFKKYWHIAFDFFEFIGKDEHTQIDDEYIVSDMAITDEMIEKIKSEYQIEIKRTDFFVDIFEQIENLNRKKYKDK